MANKIESKASIKRHIAAVTGFQYSKIVLMEASYRDGICTWVAFCVNGKGFTTNFDCFDFSPAYDYQA